MRITARVLALGILLATAAWWWKAGSNKGWTKNSVDVWKYDEITEISYPEREDRFVPGVDILCGGLLASALILGVTFIRRGRSKDQL